jgi:hypothetical protein
MYIYIYILYQGALMMEAARTSETLVNVYQTTRRYNPEDSHIRTNRRENLKSYMFTGVCICADLKKRGGLETSHPVTSERRKACTSLCKVSFSFVKF